MPARSKTRTASLVIIKLFGNDAPTAARISSTFFARISGGEYLSAPINRRIAVWSAALPAINFVGENEFWFLMYSMINQDGKLAASHHAHKWFKKNSRKSHEGERL